MQTMVGEPAGKSWVFDSNTIKGVYEMVIVGKVREKVKIMLLWRF